MLHAVLSVFAFVLEGAPQLALSSNVVLALGYNGVVGTALGYWAMTVVNKELIGFIDLDAFLGWNDCG